MHSNGRLSLSFETNSDVAALFDAYSYDRVFEAVRVVTRELAVRGLAATDVELESADTAEALLGRAVDLFSDGRVACDDYSGTAKAAGNFTDQCAILLGKTLALQESALDERQAIAGLAESPRRTSPWASPKGSRAPAKTAKRVETRCEAKSERRYWLRVSGDFKRL